MSIPSTLISGFIGLASCGSIGALIVNALWLMAVDLHRGGSISLLPIAEETDKILKECTFGFCKHHPGYSAVLNNGMTDKGYFLQVGLYFTNKATLAADGKVSPGDQACQAPAGCFGEGWVVWAGDLTQGVQKVDLGAHALFAANA